MADYIIGFCVFALFAFAGYKTYKKMKSGGCGCDCDGCSGGCNSKK